MKQKFTLFLLLVTFSLGAINVSGQQNRVYFTEYFDDGATAITGTTASAATTPTPATIKTGEWTTYYSLRAGAGCTPNDPTTTSAKELRIQATSATVPGGLATNANGPYSYLITPTLNFGVNTVSWKNLSINTASKISIYKSTDNGATFTLVAKDIANSGVACGDYIVTINDAAVNKIKFQNESTANVDIDNITVTTVTPGLPINFSSAKAFAKNNGVQVEWTTGEESGILRYEVEGSADGIVFKQLAIVAAINQPGSTYTWVDATPIFGNNFYRIRAIEFGGSKLSNIMKVSLGKVLPAMVVTNPIHNRLLSLQLSGMQKGIYDLILFNSMGQQVFKKAITLEGASLNQQVQLPNIGAGIYSVQLVGTNLHLTKNIVVE